MKNNFYRYVISIGLLICFYSQKTHAQTEQQVTATILHLDSLFWNAYNSCDTGKFKNFFTNDVEFYHDKGGATFGIQALVASFNKNLCGNSDFRLRREAVEGTVKVYPLKKSEEIYGAVISGEHVFYIIQKGKPELLDGQASFTHLWLLKNGEWKMARVLSYNHHAADYVNKRKEIKLDENKLDKLTGIYKGSQTGEIKIQREDNHLLMLIGEKKYIIFPETDTTFFSKERDLTFEFVKDGTNKISKMIVREKGVIAEEAIFEK